MTIKNKPFIIKIAYILIAFSAIFFITIFFTPFLPLTLSIKATIIAIAVVMAEITWWGGIALLGKQHSSKFLDYLKRKKSLK